MTDEIPKSIGGNLRPLDSVAILATALVLRVIFFLAAVLLTGLSVREFANLGDGYSYLTTAQSMAGQAVHFTDYDHRVFPGFSMLIAAGSWFWIPPHILALGMNWLADAAAALLAAIVCREKMVGIAMAILPPTFLMESTGTSSEPTMLFFVLLSAWLLWREAPVSAGLAMGLAMAIRPMALAALAGEILALLFSKERRRCLPLCSATALTLVVIGLILFRWNHDPFLSFRTQYSHKEAYAGAPFCLPFQNFIAFTINHRLPPLRLAYLWANVVVAIMGCVLAVRGAVKNGIDTRGGPIILWFLAPWLLLNTGVALCINGFWGVQIFPRLLVPALPALLYPYRRILPRRTTSWIVLAGISMAIGLRFFIINQQMLGRS